MKASAPAERDFDSMERFSVLVAYEDRLTHNRVREVSDRLLDQFWGKMEFDVEWWSFNSLREGPSAECAAQIAAHANLIIVSAHAGETLPDHVQRWFESWVKARKRAFGALAALVGLPSETSATPIIRYLQEIAGRAGLDFLPHAAVEGTVQDPHNLPEPAGPGGEITEGLNRILDLRRPPSHWGINE